MHTELVKHNFIDTHSDLLVTITLAKSSYTEWIFMEMHFNGYLWRCIYINYLRNIDVVKS